ncbi:hypothetical protein MMC17_008338 [Xylographa soralifera]|nr:hypothetical protein [Xylographa soralifera]
MLFSYLLVFVLAIKAFVGCTTISASSPSAASASSPQQNPLFMPLSGPRCVLQKAEPKFTLQVEKMLFGLRGDNILPENFRHFWHPSGSSTWVISGEDCELRLTPRLSQSVAVGLPRPAIEQLWVLGMKVAIRDIYLECVKYGQVGGAQLWSWRGMENEREVDIEIEIAILTMRRR